MKSDRGGYLLHDTSLIRGFAGQHSVGLEGAVSANDIEALNIVQSVAWRINTAVFDTACKAWDSNIPLPCLPGRVELPERMADDEWAALDDAGREAVIARNRKGRRAALVAEGRSISTVDRLAVAQLVADRPAIWFPHSRDYRGRMYPVPANGPHPQADDLGRALIEFAEPTPLGADGFRWLLIRAANCAGQDKLPWADRQLWAIDRLDWIVSVAADPFADTSWAELDEPWGFLATAFELAAATLADSIEAFPSRLPIPLDGTCNGLQHLAAMSGDRRSAELVNCVASEGRRDIYTEVADEVRKRLEDALLTDPLAGPLLPTIARKTVKRAVMTTPYGVTFAGIRDQLVADNLLPEDLENPWASATYLTKQIVAALDGSIAGPRAVMAWLKDCAGRLGKVNEAMVWRTPSGSLVRQAYLKTSDQIVETALGRVKLQKPAKGGLIDARRQMNGAAPNVIHSFDAAHLSAVVRHCYGKGVVSMAAIHDSFGVPAAQVGIAAAALRLEFMNIYKDTNYPETLLAGFEKTGLEFDMPPERGDYDAAEVLRSSYFFS